MIEAYAFLAVFAVQILVGSLIGPARFIRYIRVWATTLNYQQFGQRFPDKDCSGWVEHFATRFRAAHFVVAGLGAGLLVWFAFLTEHPTWAWSAAVNVLPAFYFMLQMTPMFLMMRYPIVRYRYTSPPPDTVRKATLQRRGLFDYVSPTLFFVAVASYVLFIPFAIFVDLHVYQNATLSKYCYNAIFSVTLVYVLNALMVYKQLYGRKNPIESHEGRARSIGVRIKTAIYGSIAIVWFISLTAFITKLHLESWRPFALTAYLVSVSLLISVELTGPRHQLQTDKLGPRPVA